MKYLSILLLFFAVTACSTEEQPREAVEEEVTEVVETDAESTVRTEVVNYSAEGTEMVGYVAYDASIEDKRPGIIVVHEWWGHNDYVRDRAEMLAGLGYTAFAIDMYGEGKNTDHPDNANSFMMEVLENMDTGEARFLAALEMLKQHPTVDPQKIAAIGYCFGGAVVLHMARIGTDIKGVVSFHGSLASMHEPEPGTIKADILVAHAGNDAMVTDEQLEAFRQEMEKAGAEYEIIVYEGAEHSFTNPAADRFSEDLPLAYDEEADKKSWEDMKEFFGRIF